MTICELFTYSRTTQHDVNTCGKDRRSVVVTQGKRFGAWFGPHTLTHHTENEIRKRNHSLLVWADYRDEEEETRRLNRDQLIVQVLDTLTPLVDSWTEKTAEPFPYLLLQISPRSLFTTDTFKMLLDSMIMQPGKLA